VRKANNKLNIILLKADENLGVKNEHIGFLIYRNFKENHLY